MDWPDPQEHVNMVGHPVDDQSSPSHLANNPSDIGKQITPKPWFDQSASPERGEDEMQQDVSRCVGQASFAPPGLLAYLRAGPRLAPWAAPFRRFAAGTFSPPAVLLVCDNRHKPPHIPTFLAPKERKITAHGSSRGRWPQGKRTSPRGAKEALRTKIGSSLGYGHIMRIVSCNETTI